jgi:hypothetical protein
MFEHLSPVLVRIKVLQLAWFNWWRGNLEEMKEKSGKMLGSCNIFEAVHTKGSLLAFSISDTLHCAQHGIWSTGAIGDPLDMHTYTGATPLPSTHCTLWY